MAAKHCQMPRIPRLLELISLPNRQGTVKETKRLREVKAIEILGKRLHAQ
jgi:hypothetical protein